MNYIYTYLDNIRLFENGGRNTKFVVGQTKNYIYGSNKEINIDVLIKRIL
jgi:hypothetical protein